MTLHQEPIETIAVEAKPIDLKPLVENGESPTAIILALSIFAGVLLSGVTKLFGSKQQ